MSGQSKLSPWQSAVAGATGAVVANALVYPLDIVKTRLQVQVKSQKLLKGDVSDGTVHYDSTIDAIKKIFADEGLSGLYSGMNGSLIGVASTNFAYFYWYSTVRTLYMKSRPNQKLGTAAELALGAVAGAIAQVFTIPVAVITTRQQTQPKGEKKGLIDTGKEVVNSEDGWSGLWRGLKASLVLVVNPAITYGAYQRLREIIYPGKNNLRPMEAFCEFFVKLLLLFSRRLSTKLTRYLVLGAMSKSLATIITQPLIVAKVGLQSRPPPSRKGRPFKSFVEVMSYIVEHEGTLGLFKGIGPQIMKGLLVQGLLMMTKERIELLFVLLFAYLRTLKKEKLQKVADAAAAKAKQSMPATLK
ncbi:mitochondrial carrier protein, putative [Trichophyton benhamiae CBS 112371]|uniref:Mitochondrial carrier protein, putative n=1 Tax=Arthroderma benhamiae (strain ATCC MYA-4681 / CBS 112371) TaxID=663331 RepID=D4AJS9_ARTBC|nr:mitochondrial carrier protein, putative [Trichophyton benhamiae CBS 112371]EFE37002.1 mitochondrial carrier protein, putative [Trichophyton benhamiae CBS 112371]